MRGGYKNSQREVPAWNAAGTEGPKKGGVYKDREKEEEGQRKRVGAM
jgi:hypothetical protein